MYHLRVTVTLNLILDLVLRIIISGAYLFYYLRKESQVFCVLMHLGMVYCPVPFSGHVTLTSDHNLWN